MAVSIFQMKRAALVLLMLLVQTIVPGALAHADEQLLSLIAQVRQRGCRGHDGAGTPLRWSDALARAAGRVQKGEAAQQAVEREGYRLTRVFHADLTGYRNAADVARALAAHYCEALTDERFLDFGFYRQGQRWTVVLGAPFQVPQLADRRAVVQRVLALTNAARAKPRRCGDQAFAPAQPLRWDEQLGAAATRHAQDMATHGYLDHRGRDGTSPAQRVTRAGYRWAAVGENVAAGQVSPEEVVKDWLTSPGHCATLMNPSFTELGVSFAVNLDAREAVYWAQAFGRPR